VRSFSAGAVDMFTRHSSVERYAWYPWITHNHLVADDGTLTPLGTALADRPPHR
jgi:hypothetical protein